MPPNGSGNVSNRIDGNEQVRILERRITAVSEDLRRRLRIRNIMLAVVGAEAVLLALMRLIGYCPWRPTRAAMSIMSMPDPVRVQREPQAPSSRPGQPS
jgi:hypothetical protein